jgi:hypothetical protein
MSPELDTLDQLLGGDLSLATIRKLYLTDSDFAKGTMGLLADGDVRLLAADGVDIPQWRWRELFHEPGLRLELEKMKLRVTRQGAARVT